MGESTWNVNGYAGNWAIVPQIRHGWDMPETSAARIARPDHDAPNDTSSFPEGGVRFVSEEERARALATLEERGGLTVVVAAPRTRGTLASLLEDQIESALESRGAAPSLPFAAAALSSLSDADAKLSDQIFRAKKAGFMGLVLSVGSLAQAGRPTGVLESTDAAFLRFYAKASAERPLLVLLSEDDMYLGAYGDPIPLTDAIFGELEDAEDGADDELDTERNVVESGIAHTLPFPEHAPTTLPFAGATEASTSTATTTSTSTTTETSTSSLSATDDGEDSVVAAEGSTTTLTATVEEMDEEELESLLSPLPPEANAELDVACEPEAPVTAPSGSAPSITSSELGKHVAALGSARGPQSLATLEATFVKSYVPVDRELGMGFGDVRAKDARDEFRRGFARAYTDAFPTLAVRGRRPKMVLDVWDHAHQISKACGARTAHVLVVDAMRFDIGVMIRDELRIALDGRGGIVDESILWAALPSTTARQLETLARGKIALSSPAEDLSEIDSLRGRAADEARRMRIGSRELRKLDLVIARLMTWQHAGERGVLEIMPTVAKQAASAIMRAAAELPPRALLLVTGDHGFTFDAEGHVVCGGASPEEVLVPAFACLLVELH